MKALYIYLRTIFFVLAILTLGACSDDKENEPQPVPPEPVDMTLFMFMPWSDLTSQLQNNISDMQSALSQSGNPGKKVVVFIAQTPNHAELIDITGGGYTVLKEYSSPSYITPQGIASLINDVKEFAPANRFAMTIGCHGTGWLPNGALDQPNGNKQATKEFQPYKSPNSLTRYFGGLKPQWQIEVSTLVSGLEQSGTHLEYILFDACYMGCVEVAYELRNVAETIVFSPSEVMNVGMPYQRIGNLLLEENVDWEIVCQVFQEFFSSYIYPCGTLSAIDSHKLEELAAAMQSINSQYEWNYDEHNSLQSFGGFFDGYIFYNCFYDFGQFVETISQGNDSELQTILSQAVIASAHTQYCYVDRYSMIRIDHYSGMATSQPSHSQYTVAWPDTEWAKATYPL